MGTCHITSGRWVLAWLLILLACPALHAEQRYEVRGLVVSVDRAHRSMVVSCNEIPGFMAAMAMPFSVADAKVLDSLNRGALVDFTLIVGKDTSRAENIRIRGYDSAEREPAKARRLQAFDEALRGPVH